MDTRGRWHVVVPALAVLSLLAIDALRVGVAGEKVAVTNGIVEGWSIAKVSGNTLRSTVEQAIADMPSDPSAHELLAQVEFPESDDAGSVHRALDEATIAAKLRPSSPYTWSTIAALEYRLGGRGHVFEAALRNAAELGPSEPEVERDVVDYGLAVWNEVAPQTRRAIESMVTRAMKRDPAETLRLAAKRGRLAVACRHLPSREDKQWLRTCQSAEATS